MAFLMTVYIVAMAISSEAVPCSNKQHCSDCDETTNLCLTDCDAGYFGAKCSTPCSGNCKNETCKLSSDGIGVCTEGCVTGYQGESCNIPCDSPGGTCTACPGDCNGGYCQLGSSCVSGCVDSYYGTGCKTCSSRCKNCNVMTGVCAECQHNYFGNNCEHSCEHCQEPCTSGCPSGCVLGFFGSSCSMMCSENCQTHHMDNGEGDTQGLITTCHQQSGDCVHGCTDGWYDLQCSSRCSSHCRNGTCNATGVCTEGCTDGWYGPQCSSRCSSHCRNGTCNATGVCTEGCTDGWYGLNCSSQCNSKCFTRRCTYSGDCMDGCVPGYFGRGCTPCQVGCWNNTCLANNGSCAQGCGRGLYGEHCNDTCDVCLDGQCDQMSGRCIKGDYVGSGDHGTKIALCTVSVLFCLFIIMPVGIMFLRRKRVTQGDATGQAVAYSTEYSTLHRYWEIRDEDVNMHCEPPVINEEESDQDADIDMPVLAEVFQNDFALSTPSRSPTSSLSSCEDSESYTHLERDDDVSDTIATESYLSPVEDISETLVNDLT